MARTAPTTLQLVQSNSLPGLVQAEIEQLILQGELAIAEADEIYDVREALDQLIGQRVAERATPAQLRDLEALVARMDEATAMQDIKRYHALNLQFHDMLVEFAGNARLTESYRVLTKELLLFRLRGLQDGGGFAVSNTEHRAVLDAVAARDGARAGHLLRQHAARSRVRMHKAAAVAAK